MASLLRQIVAGPRARHPEAGLDLCYVTDSIIATSGPSGTYPQRAYRTPLNQLVKFLDKNHGADWAIWEFRAEGTGYPDDEVYGRVWHFPWPDHHPPPFALVPRILASMRNWLKEGGGRVVVVHCKAGKGRSGTVSCSYLIAEEGWKVEDALGRFTERRMRPGFGAGVSIPSQLRWIGYVDRWTKGGKLYVERQVEILEVHVWGLRDGVKVSVEGFVNEGKVIKTFHGFNRSEREVVRGTVKDAGGLADVVAEVMGRNNGSKAPKSGKTLDSPTSPTTPTDRRANKEAPDSLDGQDDSDSGQGGGDVIFRPASRVVLPTNDINIDFERRNKAVYGYTMVTSVAHVWFNTFFEGKGPEKNGQAESSGTFELEWEKMDGIKGSSRKGTKAFDKFSVIWRALPDAETGQPGVVITEPKEGEDVQPAKPADWKGAEASDRPEKQGRDLGLRTESPVSGSPDISRASSVRSSQKTAEESGIVAQADSITETMGLRSHGPDGPGTGRAAKTDFDGQASTPELGMIDTGMSAKSTVRSPEPVAGVVGGKEHVSTGELPGGVPEKDMETSHEHTLGQMKAAKKSESSA